MFDRYKEKKQIKQRLDELMESVKIEDVMREIIYKKYNNYRDYEKYGDAFNEIGFDAHIELEQFDTKDYLK